MSEKDNKVLSLRLGSHRRLVVEALNELKEKRIIQRIWAQDYTVWGSDPAEITNRMGWLQTIGSMQENHQRFLKFVDSVRADGYTHGLLLGMGGSSLAPDVFSKIFCVKEGYPEIAILDSTDPEAVLSCSNRLDMAKTLFIVSTKSGSTVETLSFFNYFFNQAMDTVGSENAGRHFVAITDPGSRLEAMATRHRFRATFLNDPNIGGRYSALSYFGLVPASMLGMDVMLLLKRAGEMASICESHRCKIEGGNHGAILGCILGELAKAGLDKITFILSPRIRSFGDWVEQLIAESTGKEGKGLIPVVGEPLGPPSSYGNDRLFIYLKLEGDTTHDEVVTVLEDAGQPMVVLRLLDPYDLGGQIFLWEMATVIAGQRMGVNPFDQPNVEASKLLARKMVATYKEKGVLPKVEPAPPNCEALRDFLTQAEPGDYIAIQAYLAPTDVLDAVFRIFRVRLQDRYRLATTVGYGPRFLHSTGQLHKGDGGNGLFIQLTADSPRDVPIPDEPGSSDASITFGILKTAQAKGDRQALIDGGRRVIHFHLSDEPVQGIERLMKGL